MIGLISMCLTIVNILSIYVAGVWLFIFKEVAPVRWLGVGLSWFSFSSFTATFPFTCPKYLNPRWRAALTGEAVLFSSAPTFKWSDLVWFGFVSAQDVSVFRIKVPIKTEQKSEKNEKKLSSASKSSTQRVPSPMWGGEVPCSIS